MVSGSRKPHLDKNSYPISLAHASYILLIKMKVSSLLKLVGRQIRAFKKLDSDRFTQALPPPLRIKAVNPQLSLGTIWSQFQAIRNP